MNVGTAKLKQIVHSFQRTKGNEGKFPSKDYVRRKLKGKSLEFGESSYELWKKEYSEPVIVPDGMEQKAIERARSIFPIEAVSTYKNADNTWTIDVAMPLNHRAYEGTKASKHEYLNSLLDVDNRVTDSQFKLVKDHYDNADHYMVTIPNNTKLTDAEAVQAAQDYFREKVSSNRGFKRDFGVGSRLTNRWNNGKKIALGIRIWAPEEKAPVQPAERVTKVNWDAVRHERELVDPYLREQWEREY